MKIIKKPFINKKTNQLSVSIPKKSLSPRLRYNPNLFFEIRVFKGNRRA